MKQIFKKIDIVMAFLPTEKTKKKLLFSFQFFFKDFFKEYLLVFIQLGCDFHDNGFLILVHFTNIKSLIF